MSTVLNFLIMPRCLIFIVIFLSMISMIFSATNLSLQPIAKLFTWCMKYISFFCMMDDSKDRARVYRI